MMLGLICQEVKKLENLFLYRLDGIARKKQLLSGLYANIKYSFGFFWAPNGKIPTKRANKELEQKWEEYGIGMGWKGIGIGMGWKGWDGREKVYVIGMGFCR